MKQRPRQAATGVQKVQLGLRWLGSARGGAGARAPDGRVGGWEGCSRAPKKLLCWAGEGEVEELQRALLPWTAGVPDLSGRLTEAHTALGAGPDPEQVLASGQPAEAHTAHELNPHTRMLMQSLTFCVLHWGGELGRGPDGRLRLCSAL